MNTLYIMSEAEEIAQKAHEGQFRRDGVTPYFEHPRRVAEQCRIAELSFDHIMTAYLHDVIEDTEWTLSDLEGRGVPSEVVTAVAILTKHENESYSRYIEKVKSNPIALAVKIQDIFANLADNPTDKQVLKYTDAIRFLLK